MKIARATRIGSPLLRIRRVPITIEKRVSERLEWSESEFPPARIWAVKEAISRVHEAASARIAFMGEESHTR
jgi:hypothetical protein